MFCFQHLALRLNLCCCVCLCSQHMRSGSCASFLFPQLSREWVWWLVCWGRNVWMLTWKEHQRWWPVCARVRQVRRPFTVKLRNSARKWKLSGFYWTSIEFERKWTILTWIISDYAVTLYLHLLRLPVSLQYQKTSQRFWKTTPSRVSGSLLWLIVVSNPNSPGTKFKTSTGSILLDDLLVPCTFIVSCQCHWEILTCVFLN